MRNHGKSRSFAALRMTGIVELRRQEASLPSRKFASQRNCHPEAEFGRLLGQTESKDLWLFLSEFPIRHTRSLLRTEPGEDTRGGGSMAGSLKIVGDGLAACCATHLLRQYGFDVSAPDRAGPRRATLLLGAQTQSMLRDVFGHLAVLRAGHKLRRSEPGQP